MADSIQESKIIISRKENIEPFLEFTRDCNPAHYAGPTAKRILDELGIATNETEFIISPGLNTLLHLEDLLPKDEHIGRIETNFEFPLILKDERILTRRIRNDLGLNAGESGYNLELFTDEPNQQKRILYSAIIASQKKNYLKPESLDKYLNDKEIISKPIIHKTLDEQIKDGFLRSFSKNVEPRNNKYMIPICYFPPAMLSMVGDNPKTYKIYARQSVEINYDADFDSFNIYGKVLSGKRGMYKIFLFATNEKNEPIVSGEALAIEREFKKA